jgi:hypothetical protein
VLGPLANAGEHCNPQNAMRSPGAVLDVTATLSSAMVPAIATTMVTISSHVALIPTQLLLSYCADNLPR